MKNFLQKQKENCINRKKEFSYEKQTTVDAEILGSVGADYQDTATRSDLAVFAIDKKETSF